MSGPRRPSVSTGLASLAALALLGLTACGTAEQATVPPDNIAAGASDAPVTPPPADETAEVDAPADTVDTGADPATSGIAPAPGVTPEPVTVPAAYDFAGTTVGGREFEGAKLNGSPTVMWFWAPWCSKCVAEIGTVQALTSEYADEGVDFVGVGSLDADAAMKGFTDRVQAPQMTHLSDPNGLVWRHFGTTAQSTFLVMDGDGKRVDSGFMSEADLNAAIKTALG